MNHAKGIFIRAFILAILLLPFMLAANLCRPKFIESLHMQVVDADGYAIPNVSISLRYQRSATVYVYENGRYVPDYRTTNPVYTDWRGQANVTVVNTESDSSKLDCNIQVTLEYFGKKYYHTISLKDVPPDYFTFTLSDVRRVHVRVLDEGRAVPSFKLYVSARGTDASWSVNGNEFYVELPEGSIQGYVYNPAKDLKMFFSEYVNKDYGGLLIDFRRVPLTIKVSDDLGMPLPFTVIVDGKSYFGAKNGVNISLYDKPINATLLVNGTEMAITLNPKLGEQSYYIDRHSPYLVNTRLRLKDKDKYEYTLSFMAVDRGNYASGVASAKLYTKGEDGEWHEYSLSYDGSVYVAEFYGVKKDVDVKIVLKDEWGNERIILGKVDVSNDDSSSSTASTSQSSNEGKAADSGSKKSSPGLLDLIIKGVLALVGLLVVGSIIYYIKVMYLDEGE